MSIESHYEIVVSLNGMHLFTTQVRYPDAQKLCKLHRILVGKFPHDDGYKIDVFIWSAYGQAVDMDHVHSCNPT